MQKIFETSLLAGNPALLIPAIVALVLFPIFIHIQKENKCSVAKKVLVVIVVLLIVQAWFAVTQRITYKNIVSAYQCGDYLTISGEVRDYILPATVLNKHEQFTVNGIEFSYGGGQGKNYFGYDKTALDGGAITQNGVMVDICYITYDGLNVIVRLDVK